MELELRRLVLASEGIFRGNLSAIRKCRRTDRKGRPRRAAFPFSFTRPLRHDHRTGCREGDCRKQTSSYCVHLHSCCLLKKDLFKSPPCSLYEICFSHLARRHWPVAGGRPSKKA